MIKNFRNGKKKRFSFFCEKVRVKTIIFNCCSWESSQFAAIFFLSLTFYDVPLIIRFGSKAHDTYTYINTERTTL